MRQVILKWVLVGAAAVCVAGLALVGYSVLAKDFNVFSIGGAIALAGLQGAMNSHVALLRSVLEEGAPNAAC